MSISFIIPAGTYNGRTVSETTVKVDRGFSEENAIKVFEHKAADYPAQEIQVDGINERSTKFSFTIKNQLNSTYLDIIKYFESLKGCIAINLTYALDKGKITLGEELVDLSYTNTTVAGNTAEYITSDGYYVVERNTTEGKNGAINWTNPSPSQLIAGNSYRLQYDAAPLGEQVGHYDDLRFNVGTGWASSIFQGERLGNFTEEQTNIVYVYRDSNSYLSQVNPNTGYSWGIKNVSVRQITLTEQVKNGTFYNSNWWSLGTGVSITGGALVMDSSTVGIPAAQGITTATADQKYLVEYEITAVTNASAGVSIRFGNALTDPQTTTGSYSQVITAANTDRLEVIKRGSAQFGGTIDNISIVPVTEKKIIITGWNSTLNESGYSSLQVNAELVYL